MSKRWMIAVPLALGGCGPGPPNFDTGFETDVETGVDGSGTAADSSAGTSASGSTSASSGSSGPTGSATDTGADDDAGDTGGPVEGGEIIWETTLPEFGIRSLYYGVTLGHDGGPIAAGFIKRPNDVLALVVASDPDGNERWRRELNYGEESVALNVQPAGPAPGDSQSVALSVLGGGNAHVSVLSSTLGEPLWDISEDRGGDRDVYYSTAFRDSGFYAAGQATDDHGWVVRYDTTGLAWEHLFQFGIRSETWSIALDSQARPIVGGIMGDDNEVGTWWLARLGEDGSLDWIKSGFDIGSGIRELRVDTDDSICVAGFRAAPGGSLPWIARFTPSGAIAWEVILPGPEDSKAVSLSTREDGMIYVAGARGDDAFAAAVSPGGELVWDTAYDPSGGRVDVASSITVAPDGELYLAGRQFIDGSHYRPWLAKVGG